jgi:hypothetical protein
MVGRWTPETCSDQMQFRSQLGPSQPQDGPLSYPPGRGQAGQMRAACRNRTDDLLITSEMLYRLS